MFYIPEIPHLVYHHVVVSVGLEQLFVLVMLTFLVLCLVHLHTS